jgi:hypothetical protein
MDPDPLFTAQAVLWIRITLLWIRITLMGIRFRLITLMRILIQFLYDADADPDLDLDPKYHKFWLVISKIYAETDPAPD